MKVVCQPESLLLMINSLKIGLYLACPASRQARRQAGSTPPGVHRKNNMPLRYPATYCGEFYYLNCTRAIKGMVIICFLILPMLSFSQESFPGLDKTSVASPDAGSIIKSANIPVSYYTGIPSVTIPLWETKGRKLKIGLSLQYHASGIKVEDIAGWVGLGWSLNGGGVISRTVRGMADDRSMGYLSLDGNSLPLINSDPSEFGLWDLPGETQEEQIQYLRYISENKRDAEPDIFSFSFNGRSGKFFFDPDGNIILQSVENLKLEYILDISGQIISWEITDEEGNVYLFGTESCIERTKKIYPPSGNEDYISSWYLLSVHTANNEDVFSFEYSNYTKNVRYSVPQSKISGNFPVWDDLLNYTEQHIDGKYLSRIISPRETIEFKTEDVYQYVGGNITCLREIRIYENYNGILEKTFKLDYSFFPIERYGTAQDYLPPSMRLRLDKVHDLATGSGIPRPPTMFFYNQTPLPPRGSFSRDHWGYYNGADNDHLVPAVVMRNSHSPTGIRPYIDQYGAANFEEISMINLNIPYLQEKTWEYAGADREPDTELMKAGILERIVYPTGGSTHFEYESHDFGFISRPVQPVRSSVKSDFGTKKTLIQVRVPQEIRIIPLFYINEGSNKDINDEDPSDQSMVYIRYHSLIDNEWDTIFLYDYKTHKENTGGYEAFYKQWLPAGEYELYAYAHHPDDIVMMLVDVKNRSTDTWDKIFSKEYEQKSYKAGEKYFPDDKSEYRSVNFSIDEMDYPLVNLSFLFRSGIHPNRISTTGLEAPFTILKISKTGNPELEVFNRSYYEDDLIQWNSSNSEYEYAGEYVLELSPGEYKMEFIPRIESEFGFITVDVKKIKEIYPYALAGGLRIARIFELDNASDTLEITRFDYTINEDGLDRSSGVLMNWPVYYDVPEEMFYMGSDFALMSNIGLNLYSFGKADPGNTSGSHIGYSQVSVSRPGAGKTVLKYSSSLDYPDISSNRFPFPPAISYDRMRGLLKEKLHYSEVGILQKKEIFDYNLPYKVSGQFHYPDKGALQKKGINDYNLSGKLLNQSFVPALRVVQKTPGLNNSFVFEKYYLPAGWNVMLQKEEINYDLDGKTPLTIVQKYTYDSVHLQLKKIETWDSDGNNFVTRYTYPQDIKENRGAELEALVQKHIIASPVITETFRDSIWIKGSRTNFGFFNNGQVFPENIELLEGENYQIKLYFDKYDSKGNILQYHKKDDIFYSINWDPLQIRPIAKIENSEYHQDIAAYPSVSFITNYSYHPFWGIVSEAGPDNISTHYNYNSYGDLETVYDDDWNLLKKHDYFYKSYSGDTSRIGPEIEFFIPSTAPESINSWSDTLVKTCSIQMNLIGGSLGTEAEWVWYSGYCGGKKIGTGSSIVLAPLKSENYFVRAEGKANNTACAETHIHVIQAGFYPDPPEMIFDSEGVPELRRFLFHHYTGCDPVVAELDVTWLSFSQTSEDVIEFYCEQNPEQYERTGYLSLFGNGVTRLVPVLQEAGLTLLITLTASSSFVQAGDSIRFTTIVENGLPPFNYTWELKNSSEDSWTVLKNILNSSNHIDLLDYMAGAEDFYIRCTVFSGNSSVSETILITVAN